MTTRLLINCKTIKPECNTILFLHKVISVILNRYNINDTNLFIDEINKNQKFIKENILQINELCIYNFNEYNIFNRNKFDTISDEYIKNTIYSYLNKNQKEALNVKDILDNKTSVGQYIYLQFLTKIFDFRTYYCHLCQCNNEYIKNIIIKLENEYKKEIKTNNSIDIFYVKIKDGFDDYIETGLINLPAKFFYDAIPSNELNQYLYLIKKDDNLIDTIYYNKFAYYLIFQYNNYIEEHTEDIINKYKIIVEDIKNLKTLQNNIKLIKDDNNIKNYVSIEEY